MASRTTGLRGTSGTTSFGSSNLSAGLKAKGTVGSKAPPPRLQPLPGDPNVAASKAQRGSITSKTTPTTGSTPVTRKPSGTSLKPLPAKPTALTRAPVAKSSNTNNRPVSVDLGSKEPASTSGDIFSQTLPASSSKRAAAPAGKSSEAVPAIEPKAAFGSVDSSPERNSDTSSPAKPSQPPTSARDRRHRVTESVVEYSESSESDYSDEESDYTDSGSDENDGDQQKAVEATPPKPVAAKSPASAPSAAKPPATQSPQRPSAAAPTSCSPAKTRATASPAKPVAAGVTALLAWPAPTPEQLKLLQGRSMEARCSGEYVCMFPESGVFACVKCRSAVAGAKSKIRGDGVYATFDKYCAANLRTELQSKMQETHVLVLCKKCSSFLGRLSYDGPTESGECLIVNSGCVRYCDVKYTGFDATFDEWEAAHGGHGDDHGMVIDNVLDEMGDDELMYLDEEEIARRKAAAWGRSGPTTTTQSARRND